MDDIRNYRALLRQKSPRFFVSLLLPSEGTPLQVQLKFSTCSGLHSAGNTKKHNPDRKNGKLDTVNELSRVVLFCVPKIWFA